MFLDNTPLHKAKTVRNYVAECGDIRLEYLVSYTPEMSPIETEWQIMIDAIGNRACVDLSMVRSVRAMIRKDKCRQKHWISSHQLSEMCPS